MSKSPASPTLTDDLTDLRAALLRTALVLTHNRADAEDLVQIALMRAFDRAATLPSHTNWAAWLRTVVRHLAVDLARRKHRWRTTEWNDAVEMARGPGTEVSEPEVPNVSAEQLQAAVASIDDHYQTVYRLFHVEGASYAQVAAALNIPVRTVGTRLHRARGRIRESLLQHLDVDSAPERRESAVA
jgi:RNA polymerase sigma-70 factor (ECF subfamily)